MKVTKDYKRIVDDLNKWAEELNEEGWDGYLAKPIDKDIIKKLTTTADLSMILQKFELLGIPQSKIIVVPHPTKGGVQFEHLETDEDLIYFEVEYHGKLPEGW